ncbi:MAG: OmpA family protein [Paludibacteraceae bacterium]|nr:OmpA family protein [Paludibacteraceae bacterium]
MKQILISIILCFFLVNQLDAQKIRWSYKIEGSEVGAGKPVTYRNGYNKYAAAVLQENKDGKEPSKNAKSPAVIKYYFMPFDAQQVVICENYNVGAIVKIEIESLSENSKETIVKTIYQEDASPVQGFRTSNYNFEPTKHVTCVNVYLDYVKIPGVNQISGVGLTDFREAYTPEFNFAKENPFEGEPMYMNDDVSGMASPTAPIVSVDGKYIYFSHEDEYGKNQIYRGVIGYDGRISKVEWCDFNLPLTTSTSSALTAISQDNNVAYVNAMNIGKTDIYKTYLKRDKKGKTSWEREKLKISGFNSKSEYISDCMSYDGQYYFVDMERTDGENKYFDGDIYVAFRNEKGEYGNFKHMGYDINTTGDEIPCFLAADNKTFVFASSGHFSYGAKDIFITKRLDDTWQNWSQPINIGKIINTKATENYFTIDSKGEYAYFIRWENKQSNLYRIKLHQPEKETPKTETIKPEPVIVVHGKVLDKKTNNPVQTDIIYTNILTGEILGRATSNGETGEYTVALPAGIFYSYLAKAEKHLPASENVDARELAATSVIEKNLYLVPIEVGQTIRLNNIFFDFGKATLKPESNEELDNMVKILNENSKMEIQIAGHTDNVGSDDANMKLSDDRANAVRSYLISKGINETRITAKGFGETKPIATNDTDEGRQINRRVEFTISKY